MIGDCGQRVSFVVLDDQGGSMAVAVAAASVKSHAMTTIVGVDQAAVDRCRPVFLSFPRKVAHMGPVGTGQLTKLLITLQQ